MAFNVTNKGLTHIALLFLSASFIAVFFLSTTFEYTVIWRDDHVYLYVALMCTAGLFFLFLAYQLCFYPHYRRAQTTPTQTSTLSLRTIFIIGLVARILFVPSNAILEDDFYRYFFDGSVVSHGKNPYSTSPKQVLGNDNIDSAKSEDQVEPLSDITKAPLIHRVAYPDIQSIYPPVAQAFFALSTIVSPYSVETWRLLLVFMEVLTFYLCLKLLRLYKRPNVLVILYWLNPLVITEGINAAHMDILLPPFLLGTLLSLHHRRFALSALLLAGAVGTKLWPILLVPVVVARLLHTAKSTKEISSLVTFIAIFGSVTGMLVLPQLLSVSYYSGLHQYSQYWQVNSFLFTYLNELLVYAYELTPIEWILAPEELSRLIVATAVLMFVFSQAFMQYNSHVVPKHDSPNDVFHADRELVNQWLAIAFLVFILSPTGYPWYTIWFIPLLSLAITRANWAMLLLTISLPLYDLRYPEASSVYFDAIVVPLSFAPILALLVWQYLFRRSQIATNK